MSRGVWGAMRTIAECSRAFSFFFSSRRRHTRLQGDWSSDVCSSDLQTSDPAGEDLGAQEVRDADALAGGGGLVGGADTAERRADLPGAGGALAGGRSGERRGGEEGRSRWAADH